jgi:Bifunctional DNA primase/polymerase, N-terminal/Primase C terminal 2 (PriCT-2)
MQKSFWEAGYRVFGLHPIQRDGSCGCGNPKCNAVGKHPLATNWQHTPHWSEDQIDVMAEVGQFDTGYGVLVRGLIVIDVDARNGGVESYERLLADVPAIGGAGLIVQTGSGGGSKHLYFKCDEGLALIQHHPDYPGIDFKSSGFVVGPGSRHVSGNTYVTLVGSPTEIDQAPAELIHGLSKPDRHRAYTPTGTVDVSHDDLADMLSYINPDIDHETWIRCGMAIHHATLGTGFDVWDDWSSKGKKYPGRDILERRWHSFGKAINPVTLGTLIHYAEGAGWVQPVTFEPNGDDDLPVVDEYQAKHIDISNIDLKRPPGFVGTVAEWIHDQCRYKREKLAVAAAIVAIGDIIGLRYSDDVSDVTSNVFAFCVAASGTGKESIQQAAFEIHKVVGIQEPVYSTIKSEQEVIRNLTRHQPSYYQIDEVGIFLDKVKNAQKRGGAVYLEGVLGILMSVYSKANGWMPLSGDVRESVSGMIKKEISQRENKLEEGANPTIERELVELERSLEQLRSGLRQPFLSLLGFTTGITFSGLVTQETAANGFFGRALIFEEKDDVPPEKKKFRKRPMPLELELALQQLYMSGHYDKTATRIENYGSKVRISTTPEAEDMLENAMEIMHSLAEDHTEKSGMSSLFLRAKELIAKISFILAVPEGIRTVEHVRWAYALVRRDAEEKTRLVVGNDRVKDAPKTALVSRLESLLEREDGETFGVIVNKLRAFKKEDIERTLQEMLRSGQAVLEESIHPRRKIKVKRFKLK